MACVLKFLLRIYTSVIYTKTDFRSRGKNITQKKPDHLSYAIYNIFTPKYIILDSVERDIFTGLHISEKKTTRGCEN